MQNNRFLLLATLGLLIVSGLVAGFFTGSMQRILAAPVVIMPGGAPHASAKTIVAPVGTQAVVPTATAPVSVILPQVQGTVLAHDTFQRGDQLLWGTASDGNLWQGDASKARTSQLWVVWARSPGRLESSMLCLGLAPLTLML